uniref:Uncharacterized protein n=1 Tax=Moniliophthora roreri TaxID=221103 RepID=A0A0W0FRU0_MONRR
MKSQSFSSRNPTETRSTTSRRLSVASILNDQERDLSNNRNTFTSSQSMIPPNEGTANPNAIRLQSGQRTHLGPVRSSTPQPPRLGLQSLHSGRSPSIASPTNQYSPYGYTQNPSQSPVSPSHIMNIGHRQWEGSPSPPLMHAPISLNYDPPPSPPQSPGSRRAPLTSESQRRSLLENDPWIDRSQLTPHSVVCRGCGRTLSLDKSPTRKYYPGHWKHHRARCNAIQIKRETMGLPKNDDGYWDAFPSLR